MTGPELLAVPMQSARASDIQSGVARRAGMLWCTRHRASGGSDTATVLMHPSSNFMGHYALAPLAAAGVDAIGMTTRYVGNESTLLLEHCIVDIGSVIRHLRGEGYRRIVLIGNSGGGGLAALYQQQAERPTLTCSPCGGGPDLTRVDLPPADGLILMMAHPGRALLLAQKMDPALIDEHDPFARDPALDMFDPANGPPYTAGFLERYRSAQHARNERITDWVLAQLATLPRRSGNRVDDLPFTVHGTMADPRNLDLTIDPSDRSASTHWGAPYTANLVPSSIGHYTSLRSWLSQWSVRLSNGDGPRCLSSVSAPVHVIYGTADDGCYPSHAHQLFDAVSHSRKLLTPLRGGRHYLGDQPDLNRQCARLISDWCLALA